MRTMAHLGRQVQVLEIAGTVAKIKTPMGYLVEVPASELQPTPKQRKRDVAPHWRTRSTK